MPPRYNPLFLISLSFCKTSPPLERNWVLVFNSGMKVNVGIRFGLGLDLELRFRFLLGLRLEWG